MLCQYSVEDCVPYTLLASHCSNAFSPLEKGLFSQCLDKEMTGGIAKPYLTSHIGGKVAVKLNDGQCPVDERDIFYYFRTSRKSSECGTERQVSDFLAGMFAVSLLAWLKNAGTLRVSG